MVDFAKEVVPVNLEDEMRTSYLDYAMSVIVGRALPDVRDGLKPVHRRVLYSMHEQGNDYNKPYRKSARVVGDVMGKYHPHGDSAIYDTMVRMAQPFAMRALLIDGQGNFGSVDGDNPAAMRYTEVRMTRIAHEMLADIDKETVDFAPNYDESESEPTVLPARVPNLLVNGSAGIAVGMATNIPPHNLGEVVDATLAVLDRPDIDVIELMKAHLPGPDFPTAGIINGAAGIRQAYLTGRGRIYMRGTTEIEVDKKTGRESIIITELPYQVNKARLIEKIAELVKEKKIDGIASDGLRDESDKDGMRVVIDLRRGESADVMINNLYKQTQLQSVFGINMVALEDGQPRLLNLKQVLEAFVRHRREVVTRRTIYELRKARERAHVLEGLTVALENIDEIIELIKASANAAEARAALVARAWRPGAVVGMLERAGAGASRPDGLGEQYGLIDGAYHLSEPQARAILDMQLHRLTGLEQEKIVSEYSEILDRIAELMLILTSPDRLREVIREELEAIREQYADARRTVIQTSYEDLGVEDLIDEEDLVVTLSHAGYAKSQPLSDYATQRRGGRGKSATQMKEEDFVDKLFVASTHDTLLCFTSRGKVYWKKVYELPMASRGSRGRPIVNLLPLEAGERINAVLAVREYSEDQYVFFCTRNGVVKKTRLDAFSRPRTAGIIAIDLRLDDELVDVALTDGQRDVMLIASGGRAMRFNESTVREMGRTAAGVRGIRIPETQRVVALLVMQDGKTVLTATDNGYGKRTPVEEYPAKGRAGQGVIDIKTSERNGEVIGAQLVSDDDEIMLISNGGTLVRTSVGEVSTLGRNTQGVRLIRLDDGDTLAQVERVDALEDDADADAALDDDSDAGTEPATDASGDAAAGDADQGDAEPPTDAS
ncbi:MAG: DNA gyrase subunit A [Pseudomonadota bacterium]